MVLQYSAAVLNPICNGILTRLPRELRDIIYAHFIPMLPAKPIEINALSSFFGEPAGSRIIRRGYGLAPEFRIPYWRTATGEDAYSHFCFDAAVVGEGFRREMVETWYRMREFKVEPEMGGELEVLEKVSRVDRWGVEGLEPAE